MTSQLKENFIYSTSYIITAGGDKNYFKNIITCTLLLNIHGYITFQYTFHNFRELLSITFLTSGDKKKPVHVHVMDTQIQD